MHRNHTYRLTMICAGLLALSGCLDSSDNNISVTEPPGNDGGVEVGITPLRFIEYATFTSAEDVALLIPSTRGDTPYSNLVYARVAAEFAGLNADSWVHQQEDIICDNSGVIAVTGRELRDLQSPFTGELFEVTTTEARDCHNQGEIRAPGYLLLQTTESSGQEKVGVVFSAPKTTQGDLAGVGDLIHWVSSGTGLDNPFRYHMQTEQDGITTSFTTYRWLAAHSHLPASIHPEFPRVRVLFGGTQGEGYSFSLSSSLHEDNLGRGPDGGLIQYGKSKDSPFWFRYESPSNYKPYLYRMETFSGYYAYEYTVAKGRPTPATCPSGGIDVETLTPLTVISTELTAVDDPENNIDIVMDGSMRVVDGKGQSAIVTFDGNNRQLTVSLNGGVAEEFGYSDLSRLRAERCVSSAAP